MKTINLNLAFFSVLFASISFLLPACKGKAKANRDGEIQTAINAKTQLEPALAGVNASVFEGTVTLTGTCGDDDCRKNAEKSIKQIEGVKSIVNNIMIAEVQVADDGQLRTTVDQVVNKYEGVQADVSNGIVTLRGTVQDREQLQQLMQEVNSLHPQRISNQLVIKNK
jgi:osmotically-inducible protein OsmY